MEPYYQDAQVRLYLGDMRAVLPALGLAADLVLADPPYGDSHMKWDRWPEGWPAVAAECARAMWCFGSLRMFMTWASEFDRWRFSHDVVWAKNTAVGFAADRFRRRHELASFWFRGNWGEVYKDPQRLPSGMSATGRRVRNSAKEEGTLGDAGAFTWVDDGTRLATSVIYAANMHRTGVHPHQKPAEVLRLLIGYACPPGGLVVEPFAGSGSGIHTARRMDRRGVGVEADEAQCEKIALRLGQAVMFDDECVDPPPSPVPAAPSPAPLF